nr:putative ribonuclease H-like domain-containing protein [Tanacetum cinerariifolium]
MAFVSSSNNNSTNGAVNIAQVVNTANRVSTAGTQVNTTNIDNLSDAVICAFLARQPSSPQLDMIRVTKLKIDLTMHLWHTPLQVLILRAKKKLETVQKEKDGIQLTIEKLKNTSKSLNKLIDSQIMDNCKKGLGYNAVPPPHTGFFMPPKPDLSYIGLEEFTSEPAVKTFNAKTSEDVPKVVKNDNGASIIEDWKSDDEDESVAQPKIEKKTVKPSVAKASSCWVWKPKINSDHVFKHNSASITLKKYDYIDAQDYEEIDGGYVAFGDETNGILKSLITRTENLVDHKVKVIRCDNGTEFKNRDMNQFCKMKCIMRQYSVARTPQQNRVAERRNRTLIEATRTMLADLKLPTTFWAEAASLMKRLIKDSLLDTHLIAKHLEYSIIEQE